MKKKVIISIVAILLVVCIVAGTITVMSFRKPKKDNENLMPLSEKVKIGDYVSYNAGEGNTYTSLESKNGKKDQTFTTTGNEKWRVLSIENDGKYVLKSSDNEILKDSSGTYEILDNVNGLTNVIKLSDDLFYTVTANNSFSLPAGSGAVFNYTGK